MTDMRTRELDASALARLMAKLKSHLRITSNDLDDELMAKLTAAIDSAEHFIGRIILESSIKDTLPFSSKVALSRPLISVDGVEVDGVETSSFTTDIFTGTLGFSEDMTGYAVEVSYNAGMTQIPPDIVNAILLMASSLFSNPMDSVETLPKASQLLLRPHRTYDLL